MVHDCAYCRRRCGRDHRSRVGIADVQCHRLRKTADPREYTIVYMAQRSGPTPAHVEAFLRLAVTLTGGADHV
jgi:hypothetical protein